MTMTNHDRRNGSVEPAETVSYGLHFADGTGDSLQSVPCLDRAAVTVSTDIVTRLRAHAGWGEVDAEWLLLREAADEIERLRADLSEAYDACRYALADSPRWQALAETVVHAYEEARRG